MQLRARRPSFMLLLVAALVALLALLAALQYRWLGQVSEGERERLRANLRASASRFGQDFDRELTRAYRTFQVESATLRDQDLKTFAERYDQWVDAAPYPRLVKDVFFIRCDEGTPLSLAHFERAEKQFKPQDWPSEFALLRQRLEGQAQRSNSVRRIVTQELQTLSSQIGVTIHGGPGGPAKGSSAFAKTIIRIAPEPLAEEVPALVIPLLNPPIEKESLSGALATPGGYIIVALDSDYLTREFFPALAKRYFYTGDEVSYHVTVLSRKDPSKVIYQLAPAPRAETLGAGDATANLGGLQDDELDTLIPSPARHSQGQPHIRLGNVRADRVSVMNLGGHLAETPWQLVVKHRAGSLEAAVTSTRRRSLIVSFGVLLLLAVSVALVIISTQRAQRLARQQMEFVSAVSHELRTPLAVIRSAGENLADGVIDDREQVRRYGALIQGEGRRLTEMVEQVLTFAGAQSGRQTYELRPVNLGELVESVLAAYQSLIAEGGFQVEAEIEPYLPLVLADAAALRNSIQNLLSNAMKYSGESRWIRLRVRAAAGQRGREVQVSVEDRGLGIPPEDWPYIFEPFYRGREVVAAQIHGNGLGLSLVKRIVEAHGGEVSVESEPGRGSTFTLRLPAAPRASEADSEQREREYEQEDFAH